MYLTDCRDLTAGLFLPPEAGGEDSGLSISKIRIKLIIIIILCSIVVHFTG